MIVIAFINTAKLSLFRLMFQLKVIASKSFFTIFHYRKMIDKAITHFGRIDLLILNAGISAHFLFEEI